MQQRHGTTADSIDDEGMQQLRRAAVASNSSGVLPQRNHPTEKRCCDKINHRNCRRIGSPINEVIQQQNNEPGKSSSSVTVQQWRHTSTESYSRAAVNQGCGTKEETCSIGVAQKWKCAAADLCSSGILLKIHPAVTLSSKGVAQQQSIDKPCISKVVEQQRGRPAAALRSDGTLQQQSRASDEPSSSESMQQHCREQEPCSSEVVRHQNRVAQGSCSGELVQPRSCARRKTHAT